jgi:hypothetical protein
MLNLGVRGVLQDSEGLEEGEELCRVEPGDSRGRGVPVEGSGSGRGVPGDGGGSELPGDGCATGRMSRIGIGLVRSCGRLNRSLPVATLGTERVLWV